MTNPSSGKNSATRRPSKLKSSLVPGCQGILLAMLGMVVQDTKVG